MGICRGMKGAGRMSGATSLQPVEIIHGALCMAGGGEDRAVVILQNPRPVRDVGRVVLARLKSQVEIGAEKRRTEFGHEFLDGVAFGTKTLGTEITGEAGLITGPMRRLVGERRVVA